jgi:hypothetical protein
MASMEKLSSPLLIRVLSENRGALNSLFAFEKEKNPRLDGSLFSRYLVRFIQPVVEKLSGSEYSSLEKMVLSLYGRTLELISKNVLGSGRYPGMDESLLELIISYAKLMLDDPESFFPAAVNGFLNVCGLSPEKAGLWKEKMKEISGYLSDITGFREKGLAAAWTCGMAVFRERGLEILGSSDPAVVKTLLETDEALSREERDAIIQTLKENPWNGVWRRNKQSPVIRSIGGFAGFGGEFLRPPELFPDQGDIVASDGENHFLLHADLFGQVLVPAELPGEKGNERDGTVIKNGVIDTGNAVVPLPERYNIPVKSGIISGSTCAFTSPQSCKIFIIGLVP